MRQVNVCDVYTSTPVHVARTAAEAGNYKIRYTFIVLEGKVVLS